MFQSVRQVITSVHIDSERLGDDILMRKRLSEKSKFLK